jgi:hypothetical protein
MVMVVVVEVVVEVVMEVVEVVVVVRVVLAVVALVVAVVLAVVVVAVVLIFCCDGCGGNGHRRMVWGIQRGKRRPQAACPTEGKRDVGNSLFGGVSSNPTAATKRGSVT